MTLYIQIINTLVEIISSLGYLGIFFLMTLESSFFPFPSEVIIIPAGFLAFKGEMNLISIILAGIAGSIFGAWINYSIAKKYGRKFLLKIIKEKKLIRMENFFEKHGNISTFNGRLIPVVRQYISFPAGLAKMNKKKFVIYTGLGAGIWITILAILGYFIGENQILLNQYLNEITLGIIVLVLLITGVYIIVKKGNNPIQHNSNH